MIVGSVHEIGIKGLMWRDVIWRSWKPHICDKLCHCWCEKWVNYTQAISLLVVAEAGHDGAGTLLKISWQLGCLVGSLHGFQLGTLRNHHYCLGIICNTIHFVAKFNCAHYEWAVLAECIVWQGGLIKQIGVDMQCLQGEVGRQCWWGSRCLCVHNLSIKCCQMAGRCNATTTRWLPPAWHNAAPTLQ